ncbi:hypothetical protein B0J18DRAFT_483568 [Chaetomium sp. MPI-SDFR-AT-0129]|nr:hypothetical protein B0J18DRAFT_483568 [Chaetomium sp. MPI-SDFR-AT-0129]
MAAPTNPATGPASTPHDLLILTDATSSMGQFLRSLTASLPDIIRISATTGCFARIGVMAYRDYDGAANVTEWSGWCSTSPDTPTDTTTTNDETGQVPGEKEEHLITQPALLSFVHNLRPLGGADWPEATRTGLARAYTVMRASAQTVIVLYADAPPHSRLQGGLWQMEQTHLRMEDTFGGEGRRFADWVSVGGVLGGTGSSNQEERTKKAQVFCIIQRGEYQDLPATSMFTYLSTRTRGACLALPNRPQPSGEGIAKLTIGVLLAWMGVGEEQGDKLEDTRVAERIAFVDEAGMDRVKSEEDRERGVGKYMLVENELDAKKVLRDNLRFTRVSLAELGGVLPCRRDPPVQDFAKRYREDEGYKRLVVAQLGEIVDADVAAISLNPVFGALWRTVCGDRLNPARDELVIRFGQKVAELGDDGVRERMKKWLADSYDWAAEIREMVNAVSEAERFPCVLLDPTLDFSRSKDEKRDDDDDDDDDNDDDEKKDSIKFTRDELLEISRSCDARVLRRLGRVLTRLTYVTTAKDLPAHIAATSQDQVPLIPMALARPEHQRKFWKVLLHTVLPGTMLAARPAALLAALSIRMGIKPLEEVAHTELVAWRRNWNTLDIPETWNSNCLGLLLEADKKHRDESATKVTAEQTILLDDDRKLFQALVDYRLLEMNLDAELPVVVGWTPQKSKAPIGPLVVCSSCQRPRSVTIMGPNNVCGLCIDPYDQQEQAVLHTSAAQDTSDTLIAWSECSVRTCLAQYVVYRPDALRVRAKCYYCRQVGKVSQNDPSYAARTTAPCVTCTKCRNRVIWPTAYRPADLDESVYQCPACSGGNITTIVTEETTARALAAENGTAFLLRNENNTIPAPLTNRSLFHTISTMRPDPADRTTLFPANITILPSLSSSETQTLSLTHNTKPLHTPLTTLIPLQTALSTNRIHTSTCTLCLTRIPNPSNTNLHPACGRPPKPSPSHSNSRSRSTACPSLVCTPCLRTWYTSPHAPGRLLNPASLQCPFCRRQPTRKALARLGGAGRQLRGVEGLREVLEESGEWVYAWCAGPCGSAKRYVERVCGGLFGGQEVEGWWCGECRARVAAVNANAAAYAGGGGTEGRGRGDRDRPLVVRDCPGCGVTTEKMYGCDHVLCVCGMHWCFGCGEMGADSAGEVYKHMSEVHRTWGVEEWDGEDYDDDEYDDEEDEMEM